MPSSQTISLRGQTEPDGRMFVLTIFGEQNAEEEERSEISQRCLFIISCCAHRIQSASRRSCCVARQTSQIEESPKPKPNKLIYSVNTFWVFGFSRRPARSPLTRTIRHDDTALPFALNPKRYLMHTPWICITVCSRTNNVSGVESYFVHCILAFARFEWQHLPRDELTMCGQWRPISFRNVVSSSSSLVAVFLQFPFYSFIFSIRPCMQYAGTDRCIRCLRCLHCELNLMPSMSRVYWFCVLQK